MTLKWTKERPAVPGWYWEWNGASNAAPVLVPYDWIDGRLQTYAIPRFHAPTHWAGPIPEPAGPEGEGV